MLVFMHLQNHALIVNIPDKWTRYILRGAFNNKKIGVVLFLSFYFEFEFGL